MEVTYKSPLDLRRLHPDKLRRWKNILAIALLLEGAILYYAFQKDTTNYASGRPNETLILEPLFADFVFPTRVAIEPVRVASSVSRNAAVRAVPITEPLPNPAPTVATSQDGSVVISPDAPGSGTAIDVGGAPTIETNTGSTGTGTTASTGNTPTNNTNTNTNVSNGTSTSPSGSTSTNTTVSNGSTSASTSTTTSGTTTSNTTTVSTGSGSTSASTTVTIPTVTVPPVPPITGGITIP